MKERKEEFDPTTIILSDENFNLAIRSLIEDAIKKGYLKTKVMNVISQTWSDMIPKQEKTKFEPTTEELAFFEKVDKFFLEYGKVFVVRMYLKENNYDWQNREKYKEEYAKNVLDSLTKFTKSVFCTFCREEKMTLANIKKYNMELWGFKYLGPLDLNSIKFALGDLYVIDQKLVYALGSEERKKYENIYLYSIGRNEDFQSFIKKYSYRRSNLAEVAMKLIWLISTQC